MTTYEQEPSRRASTFQIGAMVAIITAIIGAASAFLTLYTQASDVIDKAIQIRIRQDFAPVGTIVASILNEAEFAKAIGENIGDGFDKRKWILADGSTVRDTEFARLTGNKPVPDLRNQFIRGIDPSTNRVPGTVEPFATALPKQPFTGSTSEDGDHEHDGGARFATNGDRYSAGGAPFPVATRAATAVAGRHTHTLAINGGGDIETRPANVGVFYYIKIN